MAKGTRTEGLRPELPLRAAVRVGQFRIRNSQTRSVCSKNNTWVQLAPSKNVRREQNSPSPSPFSSHENIKNSVQTRRFMV